MASIPILEGLEPHALGGLDRPPLRPSVVSPPLDPVMTATLRVLPVPGTSFPQEKRRLWLELVERIFGLIYTDGSPHVR